MLNEILDLVYPRLCAGCGGPAGAVMKHLCWDCLAELETIQEPHCRWCGDPADGRIDEEFTCWWCVSTRPAFERARSAVRYRGAIRHVIHALKYENATSLAVDCAALLEACVATHYRDIPFDAVVAVPLHARRERSRTYNQSRVLASALARRLRLPCARGCLARIRDTRSQTNLTAAQRKDNVRGAFVAREKDWITGRRFLLVDDVMTTGATVNACSRVLKDAGAAGVYVISVARG